MGWNRVGTAMSAVLLVTVAGCGGDTVEPSATAPIGGEHVAFAYEGETGPDQWGELSPAYAGCATGRSQSPVDLTDAGTAEPVPIDFDYSPTALSVVSNGHTVQVPYDGGSALVVDGARYELIQFHFHTGSEHTVDGRQLPMELHLVHADGDGHLAVVGVLAEIGDEHPALAPVVAAIPPEASSDPVTVTGATLDARDLLPEDRSYYRYSGSLTTPPCTEGVEWRVFTDPIEVSPDQLAALTGAIHANARPVQPLGDRELVRQGST